jgi:hypothetical protein
MTQRVQIDGGWPKRIKITGGIVCLVGLFLAMIWPFCVLIFLAGLFAFIAGRFCE